MLLISFGNKCLEILWNYWTFRHQACWNFHDQIMRFKFRWDVFSESSSWRVPVYLHDNPLKYLGVTSHCVCPPSPQELQCFHSLHQDGGGHRRISFHRSDIHRGLSFAFQCLGRWVVKYGGTCIETHPVNVTMIDWHNDWNIRARWQHTSKYIKMSHTATFLHPGFVGSSLYRIYVSVWGEIASWILVTLQDLMIYYFAATPIERFIGRLWKVMQCPCHVHAFV